MPTISTTAKPRLFFADSSKNKEWRLVEKVVALIESYFQGRDDIFTFSPSRVRNVVGDLEELDVTFAAIDDPTTAFEFVQVRDRDQVEGRPWVQQILGQRESQNLRGGTMVSTTGFAETAIRLAAQQNIHLRLLLPEEAVNQRWVQHDALRLKVTELTIHKGLLTVRDGQADRYFEAESAKCDAPLVLAPKNDCGEYLLVSLRQILEADLLRQRRDEIASKSKGSHEAGKIQVGITYGNPHLRVDVNGRICDITEIQFLISMHCKSHAYPITHRYKYLDAITRIALAEAVMAQIAQGESISYYCLIMMPNPDGSMQIGGGYFR